MTPIIIVFPAFAGGPGASIGGPSGGGANGAVAFSMGGTDPLSCSSASSPVPRFQTTHEGHSCTVHFKSRFDVQRLSHQTNHDELM